MTSSLGFVVLARRPGQPDEIVSAVFPEYPNGLEQAQNAREGCEQRARRARPADFDRTFLADLGPVEYVIGEITERTP